MTKIGDTVWLDIEGDVWVDDDRKAYPEIGPFTEVRLVEVEESLPVVLDLEGMNALGTAARVTPADGLTGVYARTQDGRWYNIRNPDTTYSSSEFGFDGDGWTVLDEGEYAKPDLVIEPTTYGAQVEFDGKDTDGTGGYGEGRVVAYRLTRKYGPWNVLYDNYKWNGYDWSIIGERNPKIIKEG